MIKRSLLAYLCFLALSTLSAQGESSHPWIDSSEAPPPIEINLPSFAPVIDKLGKAVVNISIEGQEGPANPFPKRDRYGQRGEREPVNPFDYFFPLPPELQGKRSFQSLGSGLVIHPDGYIVTNNHVVEKATKIAVTFKDEKKPYTAKVVGADKKTDIALLKVDAGHKLSAAVLGDSDKVLPGDWVIAMGNPFRFGHTATVGIVSAKSRRIPEGGPYDDFIQTDASINPGNSGGPLFSARGEVIGLNSAIFSPGQMGASGFNIGIGFAIPINLVKDIIAQLYKGGKVVRGWLGVYIQPVDSDTAEALKLETPEGALVAKVMDNSPAKLAGIQHGDVIVEFDGKKVSENDELPLMVAKTPIGKDVTLKAIRKGKPVTFNIKVQELKESEEEVKTEEPESNKLGLVIQDITPDIARSLDLDSNEGVVVASVVPGSEADKKGLRRGDVILEVDSQGVNSAAEFKKMTKDLAKNKPLLLLINRNNTTLYFTLKLE